MSDRIVDARGRSCPEPVIMTKNALEDYNNGVIQVLVDSSVAVENIKRYAGKVGFSVEVEEKEDEYILAIRK